jgi:hypothetical protein
MAANHGRPWGFPPNAIKAKVRFWVCEFDRSVPPAMGRYLKQNVPHSQETFVPQAGHLWVLTHLREVLNKIPSNSETEADQFQFTSD